MEEENSATFDIDEYVRIIRKRRYLVISVALGILSLLTWGSFIWPKTYESSSNIIIDKSGISNPLGDTSKQDEDRLLYIQNTIMSRSFIEQVIKKIGLDKYTKNEAQYNGLVATIKKNLKLTIGGAGSVGLPPGQDYFTVAYRGRDPKGVMNFVDVLVKELISENAGLQRSEAIGAYNFIDDQLSLYKKQIDDTDKAIQEFRAKHPNMIPQNDGTIVGRIENYQTAQINATIELKELQRRRENLQKQLSGEKEMTAGRLDQLNNELTLLLTKYTEDYPEVIKVRNEIREIQKRRSQSTKTDPENSAGDGAGSEMKALNPAYQQIKEDLLKTDTEIDSLKARLSELANQQSEERSMLGQMPKEQEEWKKLQQDQSTYQKVYDDLLQKREGARVSKNLENTDKTMNFRIFDPPSMPVVPVSPNRVILILVGIVLGIAAGVGSAVGLDKLDHSFKEEETVRDVLKLPVLATIPSIVTEADVQAEAKLDKKIYTAAIAYLSLIGIVFVGEVLYRYAGITIMHI